MHDLENLFDKETVENISKLVIDKMPVLNQIADFKQKDKTYADSLENFEDSLSEDLSNEFDNVMKLHYQVLDYYFTLAYFLGVKHGSQIAKL